MLFRKGFIHWHGACFELRKALVEEQLKNRYGELDDLSREMQFAKSGCDWHRSSMPNVKPHGGRLQLDNRGNPALTRACDRLRRSTFPQYTEFLGDKS